MGAAFDDGAFVQDQDLTRMTNGAEAVRDDDAGALDEQSLESFLDLALGLGIDAGGGFGRGRDEADPLRLHLETPRSHTCRGLDCEMTLIWILQRGRQTEFAGQVRSHSGDWERG